MARGVVGVTSFLIGLCMTCLFISTMLLRSTLQRSSCLLLCISAGGSFTFYVFLVWSLALPSWLSAWLYATGAHAMLSVEDSLLPENWWYLTSLMLVFRFAANFLPHVSNLTLKWMAPHIMICLTFPSVAIPSYFPRIWRGLAVTARNTLPREIRSAFLGVLRALPVLARVSAFAADYSSHDILSESRWTQPVPLAMLCVPPRQHLVNNLSRAHSCIKCYVFRYSPPPYVMPSSQRECRLLLCA